MNVMGQTVTQRDGPVASRVRIIYFRLEKDEQCRPTPTPTRTQFLYLPMHDENGKEVVHSFIRIPQISCHMDFYNEDREKMLFLWECG